MITFSIITPCLNAEKFIEETVLSVVNQTSVIKGSVHLEYLICDGGSTDRTCEIAETVLKKSGNCTWKILSEKDNSMYEAIVKGLKLVNGHICAYLNAGDIYSDKAFEIIGEVFENPTINWVSGMKVVINENSQIIRARLPYKYRRTFIRKGYYGDFLPFIQQDACFWRVELNDLLNHHYLSNMKLAGDYYLWHCFANNYDLYIVNTHISSFRIHKGQKSENKKAYYKEKRSFLKRNLIAILFDLPLIIYDWIFYIGDHLKSKANSTTLIEYDSDENKWSVLQHTKQKRLLDVKRNYPNSC